MRYHTYVDTYALSLDPFTNGYNIISASLHNGPNRPMNTSEWQILRAWNDENRPDTFRAIIFIWQYTTGPDSDSVCQYLAVTIDVLEINMVRMNVPGQLIQVNSLPSFAARSRPIEGLPRTSVNVNFF